MNTLYVCRSIPAIFSLHYSPRIYDIHGTLIVLMSSKIAAYF